MEGDDGGAVHDFPSYPRPPGFSPGLSASRCIQYPPGFIGPMSPVRMRHESKVALSSPSYPRNDHGPDTPYCASLGLSPFAQPFLPPDQVTSESVVPSDGSFAPLNATATPVNFPAPSSESSCVEATRPGLFLSTRSRTCVYAHAARHWSRVVVSLLHWRRMLGIIHRGEDAWHGQFGRFNGARLLYYHIAMCAPLFRALLAWRMAFQKFAPCWRKQFILVCLKCFSPVRYIWFDDMCPFSCKWHPRFEHELCSAYAELGPYIKKFCPKCARVQTCVVGDNDAYLAAHNRYDSYFKCDSLHPLVNMRARRVELGIVLNWHLPIKEQDRRFRAACSGSDGRTFSHGNAPGVGDDDFDDLDGVDDDFEDGFDY